MADIAFNGPDGSGPAGGAAFERKTRLSRAALFFERLWPRLWLVLAIVGLFLAVSLAGLWGSLGATAHQIVLAGFGLTLLAAIVFASRVKVPTREEAIRRLETRSGIPHRPATSYEDTLTLNQGDPTTNSIWQAHRQRLADLIRRLRVGPPAPRTDRHDPFAMRALLMLGVMLLFAFAGDRTRDRLSAAFHFGPPITAAEARLDAWVTPPPYTSKAPLLLADGARGGLMLAGADGQVLEIPENSNLIARSSGANAVKLTLEITPEGGEKVIEKAKDPDPKEGKADGPPVSEVRYTLKRSGKVRVTAGGSTLASWNFVVVPDQPPHITMTRTPQISPRGSMKLFYKMGDDYGIDTAEVVFERLKPDPGDPKTAWAREGTELKGPRLPYEPPPKLVLRMPRPTAKEKEPETQSFHELADHPWAGMRARMTLVVKDHAGNVGRSQTIEMNVPERRFFQPLARAVIEQRRLLNTDSRFTGKVLKSIDALTYEPAGFINDSAVFLGLRSVYHQLRRDHTRAGLESAKDHLWHIARRIEDGRSLSAAEQRLRDLQDRLSKALRDGASDEEMQRLMQELRQALNDYLQELARNAQNMPPIDMNQLNQNQLMSQQDLERMLNQMENMMRHGSRDQAQEMLSQLRDLLDRLQRGQMGQMGQMQRGQGQQMMQMMDQMGDIIGRQQQLMDDTFSAQRNEQGNGQQQGEGQGEGQQGERGQGNGNSPGELGRRQGSLRDQLDRLGRGLRQFGQDVPQQFRDADQAMRNSQRALEQGDLETATREEGRALEELRKGARQMAEQMMRNMGRRYGMGPAGDVPRDPLGRPQRSEGPDLGTNVKIPEEIDMQRAREILEELRKRLGDQTRPALELDYIERLLRRF
ncbi:MAG: TIGR02302 family protein [Hyphomicrobiaceae bacterium]